MQHDIDDVVAQRMQAPQVIFDPERRMNKRIILRNGQWLEPHSPQSLGGPQRAVVRYVRVIVPDEFIANDGRISHAHQQ